MARTYEMKPSTRKKLEAKGVVPVSPEQRNSCSSKLTSRKAYLDQRSHQIIHRWAPDQRPPRITVEDWHFVVARCFELSEA